MPFSLSLHFNCYWGILKRWCAPDVDVVKFHHFHRPSQMWGVRGGRDGPKQFVCIYIPPRIAPFRPPTRPGNAGSVGVGGVGVQKHDSSMALAILNITEHSPKKHKNANRTFLYDLIHPYICIVTHELRSLLCRRR